MNIKELAKLFDHTLLSPHASRVDFEKLCSEAVTYGFKMVAINAANIELCRELLCGSDVHVGAAVSFPLGQCTLETKLFETADAIKKGAHEIDYVCNVTRLKAGDYAYIRDEMQRIVSICRDAAVISKVIFENCYLTKAEIARMTEIAAEIRPDFIKTSTGFGSGGATLEDVKIMKAHSDGKVKIKAAGGIRTLDETLAFVEAGAERIGSSSGVKIVEDFSARKK